MIANKLTVADVKSLSPTQRKLLISRLAKTTCAAIGNGHNTTLLELARLGMAVDPKNLWWTCEFAEGLRQAGHLKEAEILYLKVYPEKSRDRYLIEIRLGLIYRDSGRRAKAERWLRKATRTAPTLTEPWVFLGGFLARCERFAEACSVLEQGLKAEGDVDEVWFNLGMNKRGLGDYEGARDCIINALRISPDYPEASAALEDMEHAIAVRGLIARPVSRWPASSSLKPRAES